MNSEHTSSRHRRITRGHDGWYIATREQIRIGPFANFYEAAATADDLTSRFMERLQDSRDVVVDLVRERCAEDAVAYPTERLPPRAPTVEGSLRRARASLRAAYRRFVLRQSMRELKQCLLQGLHPGDELLARLRYGWSNGSWSASTDFMRGCIDEALQCEGPILECGSGLTTLIIGIIADQRRVPFIWLPNIHATGANEPAPPLRRST